MIEDMLTQVRAYAPQNLSDCGRLLMALRPVLPAVSEKAVPFGRYLLHEERGFNLQLDVFSAGYVGGIHAHRTWGIFVVLRGGLWVEEFVEGTWSPARFGWVGPGGGQAFCPPASDWHRVGTLSEGPQTVSLHLYGPGFEMDEGEALDENGAVRRYRRSAWGKLQALEGLFLP